MCFHILPKSVGCFFYCLAYKWMLHVMLIVFEGKHVGCVFSLTRLMRSVLGCV